MDWFSVDRKGLAQLLERKGKAFVLYELIQNAWDERTTRVSVTLQRIPGSRQVELTVEDDNLEGFRDLSHAFTLFAASEKKGQADKRGRFNLGEKLVLALCSQARIESTKGGVLFDDKGRHALRSKRASGSLFVGRLPMTQAEIDACELAVQALLVPEGIQTLFNGRVLAPRTALRTIEASLPTEVAGEDGVLRPSVRKTTIRILERRDDEAPMLYEMGIPVVATDDRWHLDVQQKVPLNFDRDNVPSSYLAKVRALAVEAMADALQECDASASWVVDAMQRHGNLLSDDTVNRIATLKFGEKRVIFDPSDAEANARAASQGYTVVHGSQLSKPEWEVMRRSGAMLPAGRVTPSPKPYTQGGRPPCEVEQAQWSEAMHEVVRYAKDLATALMGCSIDVRIIREIGMPFAATYGARRLTFNLGRLGHRWFEGGLEPINDLLLHEFGHEYCDNHLSSDYYQALTRLGAKLASLALARPEFFAVIARRAT